jgi:AraC family transcriptional regulator
MANDTWTERILRTTEYIHCHLGEEIDAATLAGIACFSLHHFHRVFRGIMGESVMEYTRRLRLEQAAVHLKFDDEPVTAIALRSGYDSHEGFTRAFTARFGMPPSEFRAQSQPALDDRPGFTIRHYPAQRCLAVRYTGPYAGCGQAWQSLFGWAMPRGVALRMDLPTLGLVYDDPEITAAGQCRYEACVALAEGAEPASLPDGFLVRAVPAGTYAQALHCGPYDSIGSTYVALLGEWLPRRGVELPDEPVVEAYLNSPMDTRPEDLRTEVRVRIAE